MGPYPGHYHWQYGGEVAGHVTSIQFHLYYHRGYATVAIDGIFGYWTDLAVKDRQRRNGLVQDGIVGPLTWAIL